MNNLLKCLILIISLFLILGQKTEVLAANLMKVTEDTVVREAMDASGKEVFSLKKGDNIMAGEQEGDWYAVVKDGKQGYVEASKIELAKADEKLVKELGDLSAEVEKDINAVNQYREEASRSRLWGIVVVVLVIVIFGVGIYTTVKKKK